MVTHDEDVALRMRDGRVGAEGHRHEQYAVIGADGSVQLPEELMAGWPAGSTVALEESSVDVITIRRRPAADPGEHS